MICAVRSFLSHPPAPRAWPDPSESEGVTVAGCALLPLEWMARQQRSAKRVMAAAIDLALSEMIAA